MAAGASVLGRFFRVFVNFDQIELAKPHRRLPNAGLGKRTKRLAQIEMLYDRHVIGSAVLDAMPDLSSPSDGTHREVRGHWRRLHFKMRAHGPQRSLRKLVSFGLTIVRADRLGLA
ncbi:hypothetical protein [Burkholderia cepacia]|uniref:hypothetical protein n=1 Tax=Burkholderia cepacia TaxID=292 RepID=UPI001FC7FE25|nr:hypothetical protein [Burkholderia cepacia]